MANNIDTRVPADLHPDNVKAIDGYSETTASVLAPTERAFAEAYSGIASVFDARDAVRSDSTLTEAAAILKVDDLAQRVFAKVARNMDGERSNLGKGIAHIEAQLSAPVTAKASHSMADSIRSHVKNLSTGERLAFVRAAINDGDDLTASSVLGAPPYLSGLDSDAQKVLTRMYHERTSPDMAQRLKMMTAAKELFEQRGGLVLTTLNRAVGCVEIKNKEGMVVKRVYPQELRQQKAMSDKAFATSAAV